MGKNVDKANIGSWRILTIYFSHSGNTQDCAKLIHQNVGGDIVEVVPVEPYPRDYNTVVDQAKQELKRGYKPLLKTRVPNIETYDVVFVGSPNWWNTVAPPVMTFLCEYDLSGKVVIPFITHEGTGLGQSVQDIARACPDATVLNGLAVRGGRVTTAQPQVSEWLRKLGM